MSDAMHNPDFAPIAHALGRQLGYTVESTPAARVQGGCINECVHWPSARGPLFVKLAAATQLPMLQGEAAGLEALAAAHAVRVPAVRALGEVGERAYLALEWIDFGAARDASARLGEQLAAQHRVTAPAFGWERDNTIGSTPQRNAWCTQWVSFFRDRRLRAQLELAQRTGHTGRLQQRGAELIERMAAFFAGYSPQPSLLHGDLWGGNWGADARGNPVIFDPAVYFGDREADIAMTHLFGGFDASFHAAYRHAWPLDAGAGARTALYNLYHLLNHANLFGAAYAAQAERSIDRLLAELGH
jgi:protein-ribulosamine 3-kinase